MRANRNSVANFDPLKDLFTAQSERPAKLGELNLRALHPFQRALLTIDGTVTRFIEAYMMEPVEVQRLSQNTQKLPSDHAWLESPQGTEVIAREVLLQGRYSRTIYAYAVSLTVSERLGDNITSALEMDGEGLGRLLRENHLETYREILWYGKEVSDLLPEEVPNSTSIFISRTYRIFFNGAPIMLINEYFPIWEDRLPAHQ